MQANSVEENAHFVGIGLHQLKMGKVMKKGVGKNNKTKVLGINIFVVCYFRLHVFVSYDKDTSLVNSFVEGRRESR